VFFAAGVATLMIRFKLAGGRAAAGMVATRTGVRPHTVALSQPPPPTTSREPAAS
jgi:hypothetical protein